MTEEARVATTASKVTERETGLHALRDFYLRRQSLPPKLESSEPRLASPASNTYLPHSIVLEAEDSL
jgi:hypothetical protein